MMVFDSINKKKYSIHKKRKMYIRKLKKLNKNLQCEKMYIRELEERNEKLQGEIEILEEEKTELNGEILDLKFKNHKLEKKIIQK